MALTCVEPSNASTNTCASLFKQDSQNNPLAEDSLWAEVTSQIKMTPQKAKSLELSRLEKNEFITNRGLETYANEFGMKFQTTVNQLTENDTWIDFGAGSAIPQLTYQVNHSDPIALRRARTIAISYKEPTDSAIAQSLKRQLADPSKHLYIEGDFKDIEMERFGQYLLGTDNWGLISYMNPSLVLRKYLSGLIVGKGSLFIKAARLRLDGNDFTMNDGDGNSLSYFAFRHSSTTFVMTKSGERLDLIDWMKRIPGIQISEVYDTGSNVFCYEIRKTKKHVEIPSLNLLKTNLEAPPGRIFEEL